METKLYIMAMDRRTDRKAVEIGENLRAWRKLLGLTSQQVADRAGISRLTLRKLENGESVGHHVFLSVAQALGIADRLVEATDPWETDLGRMRSDEELPQRVRRRG